MPGNGDDDVWDHGSICTSAGDRLRSRWRWIISETIGRNSSILIFGQSLETVTILILDICTRIAYFWYWCRHSRKYLLSCQCVIGSDPHAGVAVRNTIWIRVLLTVDRQSSTCLGVHPFCSFPPFFQCFFFVLCLCFLYFHLVMPVIQAQIGYC